MLQKQFENYLQSLGISMTSLKNYRSDFSHFFGWAVLKLKSMGTYIDELSELVPFLGPGVAHEYRDFMVENSLPLKTINRRLSTLRHLSKFLVLNQITDSDFTSGIQNSGIVQEKTLVPASLIDSFGLHLEAEKISKNTIKNYQSDIRQFFTWLEKNHARFA